MLCPPASRVISGFALLVCVIGFMIDLRSFLRIFSGDFSPHRRGFRGATKGEALATVESLAGGWCRSEILTGSIKT
ncbi:hypothetical protein DFX77_06710 [Escherichia coli]|nr:hypothetical protein [Escherichia coli]EFN8328094.1 hypothetical protein [Escherichia coli]